MNETTLRIMVADDNRDAASSLAMLLGMVGNDVRVAHDGVEALRVAAEFRPEVALVDLGMPKLDGYDVCRRLRDLPDGRAMTVIAITGWGQDEDRRRTQVAGFDDHLVKPVDPETLLRLLGELQSSKDR